MGKTGRDVRQLKRVSVPPPGPAPTVTSTLCTPTGPSLGYPREASAPLPYTHTIYPYLGILKQRSLVLGTERVGFKPREILKELGRGHGKGGQEEERYTS